MKEESVGFALIGIKTEQFATFEENHREKEKTDLNTTLEFKFNEKDNCIAVFFSVIFEQSQKQFIKLQVSCHFKISTPSFDCFCNDSTIVFPKGFITHITMITVSSVRGVLHAKTEGSPFNKYLLPTLNVSEMVEDDVKFSLQN